MPEQTRDVKPCPGCGKPIRKRSKLCAQCYGGNTPEQRDKHALCGALKRNGERCRNYAGFRTEHFATGACFLHGGNAPTHEKAAAMVEARAQMATLGEPLPEDTRPTEMLLWLSRTIGGHVKSMLADPDAADFSTEVGRAKFRLLMEQVDRAARLAKQCSEANAEQVEATVKQAQAVLVANMVKEAAKRAGLNESQVAALGIGLRAVAAEASGDAATAEAEAARLAVIRDDLAAAEEQRIADLAREEAERLSGLTMPPEELLPAEEVEPEPDPTPPPRRFAPPPAPRPRPAAPEREPEVRTNVRSDLPRRGDPLLGPF